MVKKKASYKPRNPELVKGVTTFGRSTAAKRSGKFFIKKKNGGKFPKKAKAAPAAAAKAKKATRWYPADDVKHPVDRSKFRVWDASKGEWKRKAQPVKLRSSITPGTVLIVLAGKHRGKRVVFLKQLPSGLLLVTGPHKINNVGLCRMSQAYVIGTQTKIELPALALDKFDDAYFKKAATKAKKSEDQFFSAAPEKKVNPEAKANQKAVDTPILAIIKKSEFLKPYLHAGFSLSRGQFPHEMAF
eukprot:CAMPEP_0114539612 /NCGR_PEP_ID=MMETSP0114-20121206/330_1 /TAXON_ID=31324 /ORGANISM="Goniomonas sp, Strain m" /LENGTH=243 /DNA_ID=CAMNT_0001723725 /DNA_START=38 /DNA_END=769 /DNA_ORIENTATION=+